MHKHMAHDVAIFWDYENCPPPATASGWETAKAIRRVAQTYGCIKSFRAYLELPAQASSPDSRSFQLRSELQSSGVSLTDCPHNGRKDVADKMILVDMMAHAIDNPAPWTYILISGDRDFAYAISVLNLRRYQMILVSPSTAHISLKSQATACLDWNRILDKSATGPTRKPATSQEASPEPTPVNISTLSSERRNMCSSGGDIHGGLNMDEVDIVGYLRASRHRRQPSLSSDASQSVISDFRNDSTTHTAYFSASEALASPPPVFSARRHRADSTTSGYALSPDNDQATSPLSNSPHSVAISAHGIPLSSPNLKPITENNSYQPQVPPETEPNGNPRYPPLPIPTPPIPQIFIPLVNLLRNHLAKGSRCPSREDLALELDQNTKVYSMAKVERIGQYIALAERYRIITQGPGGIVLRPEWS